MSEIVSKDAFLKGHLPELDVEVPEIGTIRIRGLSRSESLRSVDFESAEREAQVLAWGILEPPLTADEAQTWRDNVTPAVANAVIHEILMLSGMLDPPKAVRDAKRSFPEGQ